MNNKNIRFSYIYFFVFILGAPCVCAQAPETASDATVTYPAEYFAQFNPYSVNDMLQRIPGISLARGGSRSQNRGGGRGLGAGGEQVLINGRRIAGKSNEGDSQLSRIPASEVRYIEIIRGTSGELDVRGGTQVINVVLNDALSSVSFAYEVNMDRALDGTLIPGGKIAATGQYGALNYFLSAEREPRYDFRDGFERAVNRFGDLAETVNRDETTDGWPISLTANFGYELSPKDTANLNFSWTGNDVEYDTDRVITRYHSDSVASRIFERDSQPSKSNGFEVGSDYMHVFDNGSRWKTIAIVNEKENEFERSRFKVDPSAYSEEKDLYLFNYEKYQERIIRSSYVFDLSQGQSIEAGVERAQTIVDTSLRLGLLTGVAGGQEFGGLTPVTDSLGSVEEMRLEYFTIHNWSMNDRMTLETTLLFEDSSISQSGTLANSRDFSFFRPKVDYRFDITPGVQFRGIVQKIVNQLSFRDFTAGVDQRDDEQNSFEGNSDIRQMQVWNYEANLEYRLPQDAGVINTQLFYQTVIDVIDNIDVSRNGQILSARGNTGDGRRYGMNLSSSLRLGFLNQPNMLLTAGFGLEEATHYDSILGEDRERSMGPRDPGGSRYAIGFRHDIPRLNNTNWGFSANKRFLNDFMAWDIDKTEHYSPDWTWFAWAETQAWGGLVYRFEARDSGERCRLRTRYAGGTTVTGYVNEVEDSCSINGPIYAIKIRGTF
ncbi:MAG: TonB-dependent receptor plug domain-containing protein [Pseudomonadota bacterium]|nr:TonB-dependent receptor plug domain-containing protein [Pseudomonadota bacterium]